MSTLQTITPQLNSLTQHGRFHEAMDLISGILNEVGSDSPERAELEEAYGIIEQMAQMSQFAQEMGVGPGGTNAQDYPPDWKPPKS